MGRSSGRPALGMAPVKIIHIALPAYTSQMYCQTFDSLTAEMLYAAQRGIALNFDQICGASDIAAVRNVYISRFLHGEADRLVFIDTDLAWQTGSIVKLIDHPADFVVGGYRARSDPEKYRIHFLPGPIVKRNPVTGERVDDKDPAGLIEVKCAPGGLVCISRDVAKRMIDANPALKYHDAISPSGSSWGLFDQLHDGDGNRWSEDLAFCLRWRAIGGKVWLDPDLTTHHFGIKGFEGNLQTYLTERAKKEQSEARAAA